MMELNKKETTCDVCGHRTLIAVVLVEYIDDTGFPFEICPSCIAEAASLLTLDQMGFWRDSREEKQ